MAVGFAIGVLSGLLGLGGGTMMIPVFRIGYAMSAITCTATSLFAVLLTAVSGVITHLRNRTSLPKVGLAAGIGGALTSPVGVWLASVSAEWTILLAAAAIIVYSAATMLRKAIRMGVPRPQKEGTATEQVPQELSSSSTTDTPPILSRRDHLIAAAIGMVAGVASGYVGVGGGFLMVPMMMQLLRMPMKLTAGTSLMAVLFIALPGTIMQSFLGNIAWLPGISVAIGTMPGAYLGSRLIPYVPERALRFLFAGMLFIAAIMLVVNSL